MRFNLFNEIKGGMKRKARSVRKIGQCGAELIFEPRSAAEPVQCRHLGSACRRTGGAGEWDKEIFVLTIPSLFVFQAKVCSLD